MMKLTAIATAAALTMSVMAPAANAMGSELNALTGAVYNDLNSMQMDLAMIQDLTLKEIREIDQIMAGGDTDSEKRNRINNILRRAGER